MSGILAYNANANLANSTGSGISNASNSETLAKYGSYIGLFLSVVYLVGAFLIARFLYVPGLMNTKDMTPGKIENLKTGMMVAIFLLCLISFITIGYWYKHRDDKDKEKENSNKKVANIALTPIYITIVAFVFAVIMSNGMRF